MATHLANAKRRSAHAGSLAFFVLVGLADIAASALAYIFGATIGAWLLTCILWAMISSVAYLHHDMTLIIFLILLIPFGLYTLFAKSGSHKAIGCLLDVGLIGIWLPTHPPESARHIHLDPGHCQMGAQLPGLAR